MPTVIPTGRYRQQPPTRHHRTLVIVLTPVLAPVMALVLALVLALVIWPIQLAAQAQAQEQAQDQAQLQAPRDAVLAVNAAFYRAFRDSDIVAMDRVWGKIEPIAVQHPSGPKLNGRALVMASWAQILLRPPNITCAVQSVRVTASRATVDCIEHLNPGTVRMQNIFHRENGAWKMIYHGPIPERLS